MNDVVDRHEALQSLAHATRELIAEADGFGAGDLACPSLLPGWTRAHVLAHLALNAEAGTRLLTGARTGVPGIEYDSVAARAEAIEIAGGQPRPVLLTALRESAESFATACRLMTPRTWQHEVRWTTGQRTPADAVLRSRLVEVLVHHVDLAGTYTSATWPRAFVEERLAGVVRALNRSGRSPQSLCLVATDTGRRFDLPVAGGRSRDVVGTEAQILAWLLGRADGFDLVVSGDEPLPAVPTTYTT